MATLRSGTATDCAAVESASPYLDHCPDQAMQGADLWHPATLLVHFYSAPSGIPKDGDGVSLRIEVIHAHHAAVKRRFQVLPQPAASRC